MDENEKLLRLWDIVVVGLLTDGAHHKQWCLEEIAKELKLDLSKVDYEKGVAP